MTDTNNSDTNHSESINEQNVLNQSTNFNNNQNNEHSHNHEHVSHDSHISHENNPINAENSESPQDPILNSLPTPNKKLPIVILFVGMAGSGKSTLLQRVYAHTYYNTDKIPYVINLDPAVDTLGYEPHLDIRDTVNYKQVMKQYELGPNGAIITSLNLFATKIDQIIHLIESKLENGEQLDYIYVDTPGQIEVFTWSASGQLITEAFASTFPTVITYVADTPNTIQPTTFMSNMLYACSILYKTRLPFVTAFNKIDVQRHEFALEWMTDFESYSNALEQEQTYSSSLAYSMSLVLDEFYREIEAVGVSALSGEGVDDLMDAFVKGRTQFFEYYAKELEARRNENILKNKLKLDEQTNKLATDLKNRMTLKDEFIDEDDEY